MKKSTVIVLLVVFLGSVLVVGIFGMQAVPWQEIVYVDKIEITNILTSSGKDVDIKYNEKHNYYYAFIYYEPVKVTQLDEEGNTVEVDAFEVTLVWDYSPKNATNNKVKVSIVEPASPPCDPLTDNAKLGRGDPIVFRRAGNVHLRYAAADSATGATLDIWLYVVVQP